ncbi:hypothetical protein CKSOR_00102 [Candidatus Kinetoplastibacterium sorsogonicusi]|uniref:CAAX prenyl protease 2/Lysostaphin resistance protein A-like domain-containing protein n=1 Tax=Candidatus Kinetoplastidibacterium kentomonadis TaxID=1576550 RepID=A0A3Q8F377_9PROT|nr:CPBP family glutamic-type intramembrane protease [Candidatus Kinetoplastibacterium sorsogonicusi]AWD32243.1 hypothetical protein CKSOR_00102 [Candidatus Kinetoplastibacterium sorsogonicusi]
MNFKNNLYLFIQEIKDFQLFIKSPNFHSKYKKNDIKNISFFIKRLKYLIICVFLLWILNIFFIGPIVNFIILKTGVQHKINHLNLSFFKAVIVAPIVEELMFRYILRKPLGFIIIYPLIISFIFNLSNIKIFLILMPLILCNYVLRKNLKFCWLRNYVKIFPYIFHLISILFALLHILNFSNISKFSILIPFLVLPQWFTGIVLGWIRMRYSIYDSILLHSLFNLLPLILLYFFKFS